MKYASLIFLLLGLGLSAQDVPLKLKQRPHGYEYLSKPFPDGIMVFRLDKTKEILKIEGLTLIQVWNFRTASRPEIWKDMRELELAYKDKGLTTLSINFENGSTMSRQLEGLKGFIAVRDKPDHLFYDGMGYVTDLLQVPGFPTYYLVTPGGQIVFNTLGEDPDGMALLKTEIEKRLTPPVKG